MKMEMLNDSYMNRYNFNIPLSVTSRYAVVKSKFLLCLICYKEMRNI